MKRFPASLAFLLVVSAAFGQEAIRLPGNVPLTPSPVASSQKLAADTLFVIDSDVECLVLTSPAGFVKATKFPGPVPIYARFVDGTGKWELRNFKGKHVHVLESAKTGQCEVLVIPAGVKEEGVIRRTLDVTGSVLPDPRPDPPKPDPVPPKPSPVAGPLWVVAIEETGEASAERGRFFTDAVLVARMRAKGHKHRVVDKDAKDKDGNVPKDVAPYLRRAAGKTLPYLFLVTEDGVVAHEGSLPATAADLVKLLEQKGG